MKTRPNSLLAGDEPARRSALAASLAGIAAAIAACGITACGGAGAKAPTKSSVPDAGRESSAPALATSPPPAGLPPMASMPPPGVAGSKKAKLRVDGALASCSAAPASTKAPADLVKRLGEACAAASKMRPLGPIFRGTQGDTEAHQESRFEAQANRCYRVYFAGDPSAKDLVVVLRDAAGDVVAAGPGPAVPEDGAACFTASGEVSVLVGVGSGKGAWAAQVWSD